MKIACNIKAYSCRNKRPIVYGRIEHGDAFAVISSKSAALRRQPILTVEAVLYRATLGGAVPHGDIGRTRDISKLNRIVDYDCANDEVRAHGPPAAAARARRAFSARRSRVRRLTRSTRTSRESTVPLRARWTRGSSSARGARGPRRTRCARGARISRRTDTKWPRYPRRAREPLNSRGALDAPRSRRSL